MTLLWSSCESYRYNILSDSLGFSLVGINGCMAVLVQIEDVARAI